MNSREFENLKQKIEDAKVTKIQAETKQEELKERLKSEFNVDTIKQAEGKLDSIKQKIELLEKKKEKLTDSLDEILKDSDDEL